MKLLRNVVLFFALFLPAAYVTGIVGGFFVGLRPTPRISYETLLFVLEVVPLLMPSLLMVPVLQFVYSRWLSELPRGRALGLAAAATPVAFLVPHLAIYGGEFWSAPLVMLFAIPGALYGIVLRH
jgi:hypothetical protein